MPKFKVYGIKKLRLAFEYGAILANTAHEQGVPLTREMMELAEEMLEQEFTGNDAMYIAQQMLPNVLSIFGTDSTPKQENEEGQIIV